MRILVIDDDRSIGAAIETLLHRQGRKVVLVEDGSLGIQAIKASNFQVVMVDIFMHGVDGLETIKGIRKLAPAVPIVAMSGFRLREGASSVPDFLEMASKLGASSCLRKPFKPQQLLDAINPYLDYATQNQCAVTK
jgi:DNA-binding NtrC family response regulator